MNDLAPVSARKPIEMLATFSLNGVAYGLNSLLLKEVIRLQRYTPVHRADPFIVGIINLRGKIVTVIDLAGRLGIHRIEEADNRPILIVPYEQEHIGLLVDAMDDVVHIHEDQVQPIPSNIDRKLAVYMQGVIRVGERLVTILNPHAILADEAEQSSD